MNVQKAMEVGAGAIVLPRPPVVSQTHSVLPDGTIDPQAANDCGEACVSSVVSAMRGLSISPGCWRQALGGPNRSGLTSPDDLCTLLRAAEIRCKALAITTTNVWERLHELRRVGSYCIVLGYWMTSEELHWMLAYEGDDELVWAMDPWTGRYLALTRARVSDQFQGIVVEVYA